MFPSFPDGKSTWGIDEGNMSQLFGGSLSKSKYIGGDERMNHHVPAGVHQDTNRNVSTSKKNVESAGAKTRRDKSSLIEAHQKQSWTTNDYANHILSCYIDTSCSGHVSDEWMPKSVVVCLVPNVVEAPCFRTTSLGKDG